MKNTMQLYIDDNNKVKGYPITTPDRVLDEKGKSVKEKMKNNVKFDVVGKGTTVPPINGGNSDLSGEIDKIKEQLDNIEINPCIFGAKGDGITNDTIAILNAIKYAKGRKIKFNNGIFLVDYFALSGDNRKAEYINSDTLNIEGSDSTIIKMNGFINSEPPSYNLGINFGFEPSIFSLNCFNKITIKNITLKGCLFDNLEEDTKLKQKLEGLY